MSAVSGLGRRDEAPGPEETRQCAQVTIISFSCVLTKPSLRRRKSTVVSLHGGTVVDDLSLSPPSPGSSSSSLARSLLSLLLSPDLRDSPALSSYLLVALGDGLATLALFIPFTFLPDLAVSKGVEPSNAAFLISAAGVKTSELTKS